MTPSDQITVPQYLTIPTSLVLRYAIPSERSLILKVQRKCPDNYLSYKIYSQINPPVHSFRLRNPIAALPEILILYHY